MFKTFIMLLHDQIQKVEYDFERLRDYNHSLDSKWFILWIFNNGKLFGNGTQITGKSVEFRDGFLYENIVLP